MIIFVTTILAIFCLVLKKHMNFKNFLSNNLHSHSAFAYRGWAAVVAPSTVNVGKGPIFPQTAEPTNPAPAGLLLAM